MSPQILAAYFVQNKARGWKKTTVKAYGNSLRAFFRYATRRGWCAPGLAETIQSPRIYSNAGLPEGPSWEQVRRLIANLNTERPSHIRDRAIILLLAVYGLRISEACGLTLDDVDWANEKLRLRRLKNRRIQEFPLTAEVGNAILKYLQNVRPRSSSRVLFLTLRKPHRPMRGRSASSTVARSLGRLVPYDTMAHTVCATPVPATSWMRDFRLKKSAITLVTAHQGRRRSMPRSTVRNWRRLLPQNYRA